MRTSIVTLLLLGFLVSCGSSERASEAQKDELSGIENTDFYPKKTVPYVAKQDAFKTEEAPVVSTAKESADRLPVAKLERLELDSDPITAAIGFCYRRQFDKAFKVFDQSYEQYRTHPSYWNQIGTCYLMQEDYRKALLFYNKALGIDSNYAPAINNFGVLYWRQGKDQLAIEAFDKASKVNSFSLTPIFNLSQIYLQYGFVDNAFKLLTALHKKNRNDMDVVSSLASCYLMMGNAQSAVAYFNQVDDDLLKRPDVSLNYAYALTLVGRKSDARDLLRKIPSKDLVDYANYYTRIKRLAEE